jgi:hypothetical protein
LVQVNPSTASFATVTGTATLGGATVNAVFASGSYVSKTYTILTASGGVSGTFAPTVVNTNLPANFSTSLSYDANDAYLNLVLNFAIPGGLNRNQQAVGNALANFFSSNGTIPLIYGALSSGALTQASGELGTSSQQTTFQAMSQFMGLLTDPFMQRNGGAGLAPGAAGALRKRIMPVPTPHASEAMRLPCSPRRRRRPSCSVGTCGQQALAARNRPTAMLSLAPAA